MLHRVRLKPLLALDGVIDYTLSELANSLMDGLHATGPDRLRVAGRNGLPQVVVPGCVDFFNQGARDTLPERYRGRMPSGLAAPRAAGPATWYLAPTMRLKAMIDFHIK